MYQLSKIKSTLYFLTVCFAGINLVSCSHMSFLDFQPAYKNLDKEFIATLEPRTWLPLKADSADEQLIYLPDGVTMARLDFKGTLSSRYLEKYLNGILLRLLEHSPTTDIQTKIQLVGDQYGHIQATPDGTIIIPLHYLQASESQDEIAWLLAHELAHIILTHHDSDWLSRYHQKLNASLANNLVITSHYMDIANQLGGKKQSKELKTIANIYSSSIVAHEATSASLFPTWKRAREDEADMLATDLCIIAGFSVDNASRVLVKLGQWSVNDVQNRQRLMEQYKQKLTAEVNSLTDAETTPDISTKDTRKAYGQNILDHFLNFTVQEETRALAKTQQNNEQRRKSLLAYTEKFYPDLEQGSNLNTWQIQKSKSSNARLFKAYTKVWEVQKELDNNQTDKAYSLIRQAIRIDGKLNRQSYPRWLFYNIRKQQNKASLAIANLNIALKAPDPSETIYKIYIVEKIAQGHYKSAQLMLDRVWKDFKNPPALFPIQIKINKLLKNNKSVQKYYSLCMKMAIPKSIKKTCDQEYQI